jgi:hypothetical protein
VFLNFVLIAWRPNRTATGQLDFEHVVDEELMEGLVAVVDAQLLERILVQDLKPIDVQDTDRCVRATASPTNDTDNATEGTTTSTKGHKCEHGQPHSLSKYEQPIP